MSLVYTLEHYFVFNASQLT